MSKQKIKITQHDYQIGYWSGRGERREFHALANFGLKLLSFVASPPSLPDYQGFLALASQHSRRSGLKQEKCFLPWYHISTSDDIRKLVGAAFPHSALICRLSKVQVKSFLQDLWEEFTDDDGGDSDSESSDTEERHALKPVVCLGRQPDSDIFVLGPELHFYSNGDVVPPDQQKYIYLPLILQKLGVGKSITPIYSLPKVDDPLFTVVDGIGRVAGDNFICALFCLAGAILSLCYESLQRRCGSVAVPIVYGKHSLGKTNFLKIALATCGNLKQGMVSFLTECIGRTKIGGSLPFAYDDPSSSEAKFKQMLIEAFGGASMETARQQLAPRCVPLISANNFLLDKLTADEPRYLSRCILLPCVEKSPPVELDFLSDLLDAAPAAFPDILHVGKNVEEIPAEELYAIRSTFLNLLGRDLSDSRLATQYSFIISCALEIVEQAQYPLLKESDVWRYVEAVMVPEIIGRQLQSSMSCTLEDVLTRAAEHVQDDTSPLTLPEVLTVVNPKVTFKINDVTHNGVAISLKRFLALLDENGIEHPSDSLIRRQLGQRRDALTRGKQYYLKHGSKLRRICRKGRKGAQSVCRTSVFISITGIPLETLHILRDHKGGDQSTNEREQEEQDSDHCTNKGEQVLEWEDCELNTYQGELETEDCELNMYQGQLETEGHDQSAHQVQLEVEDAYLITNEGEEEILVNEGEKKAHKKKRKHQRDEDQRDWPGEKRTHKKKKKKRSERDSTDNNTTEQERKASKSHRKRKAVSSGSSENGVPKRRKLGSYQDYDNFFIKETPPKKTLIRLGTSPYRERYRQRVYHSFKYSPLSPVRPKSKKYVHRRLKFTAKNDNGYLKSLTEKCMARSSSHIRVVQESWDCAVCLEPEKEGEWWIQCDRCQCWMHWHCVGLWRKPKTPTWRCICCRCYK